MDPFLALGITAAVVVVAASSAALLRVRTGRPRRGDGSVFPVGGLPGLDGLGGRATLVQFSSEFCATCPGTRRLLRRIASDEVGVEYVDVDLTHDPELASRLHILQTPTVFVLDDAGRLVTRIGGAPRMDELTTVLAGLRSPSPTR